MTEPPNQALAAYVTSVAFHLSLTRQMMLRLCRMSERCPRRSCKCDISTHVAASHALVSRGLLDHGGPNQYLQITKAGELVHALMVEAGLCIHRLDEEGEPS